MMKDLHNEANRKPNLVSLLLCSLHTNHSLLTLVHLSVAQTFVDHHAGMVDARTGYRIGGDMTQGNEEDTDAFRGGYGFFDAVSFSLHLATP